MTIRFRQIDDSNRGDHYHLTPADACLYLLEFTSGQGYSYSKANSLISNLKKKPTASAAELGYKREAIGKCAGALGKALNHDWIRQSVIVPIPPSKMVGDPAYDDRMFDMAAAIQPAADVRRLIRQTRSMTPSHEGPQGQFQGISGLCISRQISENAKFYFSAVFLLFRGILHLAPHQRPTNC